MILGMLGGRSPESKNRCLDVSHQNKAVTHLTLRQLRRLRHRRDDILSDGKVVEKVLVIGRVLGWKYATNAMGKSVLDVSLADCTDHAQLQCYDDQHTLSILERGAYVKIGIDVRCGGVVYRPEVKINGTAVALVRDYNEIVCHLLECML